MFMLRRLGLVLLLVTALPLIADQNCKPVEGHFEATAIFPGQGFCPTTAQLCTSGDVWGGIQGHYQFIMNTLNPSGAVPTIFFFTGNSTVSLKSGDQVLGTDTGSIDLSPSEGGFASLITFNGGSGSMADATGQIRLRGHFDASAGTTAGDYSGRLCTP